MIGRLWSIQLFLQDWLCYRFSRDPKVREDETLKHYYPTPFYIDALLHYGVRYWCKKVLKPMGTRRDTASVVQVVCNKCSKYQRRSLYRFGRHDTIDWDCIDPTCSFCGGQPLAYVKIARYDEDLPNSNSYRSV